MSLNERQKDIILRIKNNPRITQVELSGIYNLNRDTIKRDLTKLQELNIIKRIGSRKTGHWNLLK